MANKLTKNDIEKILPQLQKDEAIEQDKKYKKEYEESRRQWEEIMRQISEYIKSEE